MHYLQRQVGVLQQVSTAASRSRTHAKQPANEVHQPQNYATNDENVLAEIKGARHELKVLQVLLRMRRRLCNAHRTARAHATQDRRACM